MDCDPLFIDIATHGYGDSQSRFVNVREIAAIVPNAFDDRKSTIVLRSGKEVTSNHPVTVISKLLRDTDAPVGGL